VFLLIQNYLGFKSYIFFYQKNLTLIKSLGLIEGCDGPSLFSLLIIDLLSWDSL